MKTLLVFVLLLFHGSSYGQSDTLNQKDAEGLKQGYWIHYGKERPNMGYLSDGRIEEGSYVDDQKEGTWLKYRNDGKTLKMKGEFINNRPQGKYESYHKNGNIQETGNLANGKYEGLLLRYYVNGKVEYKAKYADGIEVDTIYYYYESGCPEFINFYNPTTERKENVYYYRHRCGVVNPNSGEFYYTRDGQMVSLDYSPCPNVEYDSLVVSLKDSRSTPIVEKQKILYWKHSSKTVNVLVDSVASMDKSFGNMVGEFFSHGLQIEIVKYSAGSPCNVILNSLDKEGKSGELAKRCAKLVFKYE